MMNNVNYKNFLYRSGQGIGGKPTKASNKLKEKLQKEKLEYDNKLKMEMGMGQVFEMKVREKKQKLKKF